MPGEMQQMNLTPNWSAAADQAWSPANSFLITLGGPSTHNPAPDGLYIMAGFISPPALIGTEEQIVSQLEAMGGSIDVQPVSKMFVTHDRARELYDLLGSVLEQFDEAKNRETTVPHAG